MPSSQPISDKISRKSELTPQVGCDEGTDDRLNEAPQVSIDQQIEFLKLCYKITACGAIRAHGNPDLMRQNQHSQRCLEATIRLLESLREGQPSQR